MKKAFLSVVLLLTLCSSLAALADGNPLNPPGKISSTMPRSK